MSNVLFMLPKLHGEFRSLCLEIVQSRADRVNNVFTEIKNKNLLGMLTHRLLSHVTCPDHMRRAMITGQVKMFCLFRVRDENTQLQALRLVRRLLAQLSADDILYVMDAVTSLVRCASVHCRGEAYDILMWIYDKYKCASVFNHLNSVI